MDTNQTALYTWPEKNMTPTQVQRFQQFLTRRVEGEPIAYIIGEKEFWSLPIKVSPATLVPRAETELLVELILDHLDGTQKLNILDLGTGSGAIALALAHERAQWQLLATDRSDQALAIAKKNKSLLQLNNIEFLNSNWFENIPKIQFDVIVSNPPYIAGDDPHLQSVMLRSEPINALRSGATGIEDLNQIIAQAPDYLKPGGYLCLEHGYDQQEHIYQQLQKTGWIDIQVYNDLAKLPRAVIAKKP